jgi:hypothetical protein
MVVTTGAISQQDEASILSAMFATPILENQHPVYPNDTRATSVQIELTSYNIDHCSGYDADTPTGDESMLLPSELEYDEYNPGHKKHIIPTSNMHGIPTIWQCVKNAFTMTAL